MMVVGSDHIGLCWLLSGFGFSLFDEKLLEVSEQRLDMVWHIVQGAFRVSGGAQI